MKLVRWISIGAGFILLMLLLVVVSARFADGPLGPFPGGALRSGTLVTGPVADWTFVDEVAEVELQLFEPLRSRTTWIVFRDGRAYIPCGFPNQRSWKKWPRQAERDGRALVRIKGRRYRVRLQRIKGAEIEHSLAEIFKRKYQVANEHPKEIWFFRLDSAAVGSRVTR